MIRINCLFRWPFWAFTRFHWPFWVFTKFRWPFCAFTKFCWSFFGFDQVSWFESAHDSSSISKTWIDSTHDSSSFLGIDTESTHDWSGFPKYWFRLTHDSTCFTIFWFKSTHDSSQKQLILSRLMIQLVIPTSGCQHVWLPVSAAASHGSSHDAGSAARPALSYRRGCRQQTGSSSGRRPQSTVARKHQTRWAVPAA